MAPLRSPSTTSFLRAASIRTLAGSVLSAAIRPAASPIARIVLRNGMRMCLLGARVKRGCTATRVANVQLLHDSAIETVSHAADVEEITRTRRIGFDLAPQTHDMVVHHPIIQRNIAPPGG